jgi:hypothetical protein
METAQSPTSSGDGTGAASDIWFMGWRTKRREDAPIAGKLKKQCDHMLSFEFFNFNF